MWIEANFLSASSLIQSEALYLFYLHLPQKRFCTVSLGVILGNVANHSQQRMYKVGSGSLEELL